PLLRREGLLEVLLRTFRQRYPGVFLGTREPGHPADRLVVRRSARGRSFCALIRGRDRGRDVGGGLLRRRDREGDVGSGLCRRRDRGRDVGSGLLRRRDCEGDVGSVANGSELGRCLRSLPHRVVDLCVRKGLVGTVALGKGLLSDELVGETTGFRAETVAPARDLAESVVASLDRARLRYIEGLVILN